MKTRREVTWGEPWKNCLNDEGKDLMGQKVVTTGLLWLSLGLNMDSMYARSYLTDSLLHEGGKVNWGPLATDCIRLGLGLQESSTVLQPVSSHSGLREREVQAKQPLPVVTLLQRTVSISVVPADWVWPQSPSLAASPGQSCLSKTYGAQRRQLGYHATQSLLQVESLLQLTSGVLFFWVIYGEIFKNRKLLLSASFSQKVCHILFSHKEQWNHVARGKKNEITSLAGKWTELEINMLSKQTQKEVVGFLSQENLGIKMDLDDIKGGGWYLGREGVWISQDWGAEGEHRE